MAREIANTSLDFRGVPHLLARPSKQDPEGVVVWSEIQPIIDQLQQKLDAAQLAIELQKNNAGVIKRFTLTGGTSEVRVDDADGESYTFTSFRIPTGFKDSAGNPTVDFEDFAMAASLAPWSNQGFRYEFHKEAPDVAVIEFQSLVGAFPDNSARISLARIPEPVDPFVITPTDPVLITFITDFRNWTDWDNRFGAGTWDAKYDGVALIDGVPTIKFAKGTTLSKPQADNYFNSQNLGAVDGISGANGT